MNPILSAILFMVIGAALSQLLTAYIRRPKIIHTSSGRGQSEVLAGIANDSGLIGFMFKPIEIRGKQYPSEWKPVGIPVERVAALGVHAFLIDPQTKEQLAQLFWRQREPFTGQFHERVNIRNGEIYDLMIFGGDEIQGEGFFAWLPQEILTDPHMPPPLTYDSPRKFIVKIRSNRGQTLLRLRVDLVLDKHGRLTSSFPR